MNIGIDIDNVIADFVGEFLPHLGKRYSIEDIIHYDFQKSCSIDDKKYKKIWSKAEKDRIYQKLCLVKDASYSLQQLSENHKIILISSRNKSLHLDTLEWLKKHGLKYKKLFLVGNRKEKIKKMYNCDLVIEDDLEVAREIAYNGIPVILFDYPWNKISFNIKRVTGWKQALKEIKSLTQYQ